MKNLIFLLSLLTFPLSSYAEKIKIASWNIAWLGSSENNPRIADDYKILARYAAQLDADVIALQEVEDATWANKVFGDKYEYFFSTRNNIQRVGFAVKKSSGYQVSAKEYDDLDVGSVRYGMDLTLTKNNKKLRMLGIHLKSGCFDIGLDTASIEAIRKDETISPDKKKYLINACSKLSKQSVILERWIDLRATENVPFIVLGDFNRRFSIDIANSYSEEQGLWQAIDDEKSEDLWSPTLKKNSKCWGGYYKDYIDHIVLDPKAKSQFINDSFKQIVFDETYSKELSKTLSDHCPISIVLDLEK